MQQDETGTMAALKARHQARRETRPQRPSNHLASTLGRQSGILMNVHSDLLGKLKLRNLSFLGPDRVDNLLRGHT
jgi:hypothetical protein